MTTALTKAFLDAYATVNPRDLPDAHFYCNKVTLHAFCRENNIFDVSNLPLAGNTAFGVTLHIDESLPTGVVQCIAETELDRVVRRASEEGRALNIVKPAFMGYWEEHGAPPKPTLKALLRHWFRKVKR